jgi:uncharacterized protein (TIGR00730 family)
MRESWRVFEIMAEFVQATERLAPIVPAVTVFGSARTPVDSPYYQLAERIGRLLSDAGFSVISGGGPGIMEAANKGALDGKSPSVGLNIQLPHEQHANRYQDISHSFRHFFARKVMLVKFSTAIIAMPGGYGTLDEMMEVLTLVQTRKTRNIPVILVGSEFWQGLVDWIRQRLAGDGMIDVTDLQLLQVLDDPQAVVDAVLHYFEAWGYESADSDHDAMLYL